MGQGGDRGSAAGPHSLVLAGIRRSYGAVEALKEVDLAVREGEFLTILGPSGSGKTTLLKIVAGFEYPDAGRVSLAGQDVTRIPPARRNIGMVFQHYALFPHLTVAENVAFPLEMRKIGRPAIRERVAEALRTVALDGYEARLPRQLSGGQQQRVALARAVVFRPRMLLLDEPLGALDRKLREQMQLEVKRLQHRLGLTTVFVTHDQEEALILSDRIAVMNAGRIVQLGRPQEVYGDPVDRFVAEFIGESNLFAGRRVAPDTLALEGGLRIRCPAGVAPLPAEATVLVRPERARRLRPGQELDNAFDGIVDETIYLGESVKLVMRLQSGPAFLVRWNAREIDDLPAPGAPIRIGFDRADVQIVGAP